MTRAGFDLEQGGLRFGVILNPFVTEGKLIVRRRAKRVLVHPKTDMAKIVDGKNIKWALPL